MIASRTRVRGVRTPILPTAVTVVAWIIGIVIHRWRWTIVDGWRTVVCGWCIKWRSRIRPCPKSRQCPDHTANRSARTGVTGDRTGDCPECGACDGSGHRVGIKSVAHATIGRWIGCAPSEQNDAEQGRQNKILSVFHVSSLRAPCQGRRCNGSEPTLWHAGPLTCRLAQCSGSASVVSKLRPELREFSWERSPSEPRWVNLSKGRRCR